MQSVLVVDDIAENLYFLEVLLKGNGFEVRSARDGAEALELARNSPPDLVVTDILMPVMDGYSLCREWRADSRLRQIPLIFYTATFIEKKDEELALSLGADRFVIKPQDPEVLMGIIREVLTDSRLAAGGVPTAEGDLLKEYNEALFRKLEKKMADLEQANRELELKIIEQKRLEEQLRQAQKMEAIGRFSAGIAHDFNNLLTVIIGFGDMIRLKMPTGDPLRDKLNHILAASDRATNLTRSLLTFSRKQEMKMQPLDLNECVSSVEVFLRRIIGSDIKLVTSLREGAIPVVADGGHIEQVLMNLATNARDAMPDGGILSIGTDIVEIDEAFVQRHGYGTVGPNALLTVADDGVGMDDATRQQVFEPFFSTKEAGMGTGLGLSIIYGIVKQHNGYITVYSEPGQGTTFRIQLPLISGDIAQRDAGNGNQPLRGGHETILVVDDDAGIRQYLELFLASLGYTVLAACDGLEAINVFRERWRDVDLVLMDIIQPVKNGSETAHEMRAINRRVKVVFTSGYPYELLRERKLVDDGEPLLVKPLVPNDLAARLRTFLNGDGES